MNTAVAVIIAFLIIVSFLVGAYAMYRISEHYNRLIREQIKADRDPFFVPEDTKQPIQRTRQKQPSASRKSEEVHDVSGKL